MVYATEQKISCFKMSFYGLEPCSLNHSPQTGFIACQVFDLVSKSRSPPPKVTLVVPYVVH